MIKKKTYVCISFLIFLFQAHNVLSNDSFWSEVAIRSNIQSFIFVKKLSVQEKIDKVVFDSYHHIKATHFNSKGILNISGGVQYGTERDYSFFKETTYKLAKYRDIIFIDELNFMFEFDNFDLTIGKTHLKQNQNYTFSLTTKNFPKDYTNPLSPKTLGTWNLNFDIYYKNQQLSLTFLPFFPQSIRPSSTSRWSLITTNENSQSLRLERDNKRLNPKLYQFYLQHDVNFDNVDFFLRLFRGTSSFPFLKKEVSNQLNEFYPLKTELAAGVSGYVDRFHYYSEFFYTHYSKDRILEYLVGIDTTFDEISFFNYNIEISYSAYRNLTTKTLTLFNQNLTNNSFFNKKILFKTYLNNFNELPVFDDSLIELTLFSAGLIDLERKNIYIRAGLIYPLFDGLTFNFQFEHVKLEDYLFFHQTENCNRVLARIDYIW